MTMSGLDLENLSPKQKEIFKEVWSILTYFQQARRYAHDSVLSKQDKNVGMMLDDRDREENKEK